MDSTVNLKGDYYDFIGDKTVRQQHQILIAPILILIIDLFQFKLLQ
jgi:hypothetical protein